ncbi:hypothetical protein ACFPVS_09220 [Neisseria weixii]|uniref:hypothetical protein n=1 Tax=Neisseria weixii TaxID=1853276 RepID=UPI0036222DF4
MDWYELEQNGITVKNIRPAKRHRAWPWMAVFAVTVLLGLAAVVADIFKII